jgi:hypothetical protein
MGDRLFFQFCIWSVILMLIIVSVFNATAQPQRMKIVVLAEHGGIHRPFVDTAIIWLNEFAQEHNFSIDYIENPDKINEIFLSQYQLFIQLDYPPYMWGDSAKAAFEKYIDEGRGGWVGFHHASLLGEFDGFKMWPWFSSFMGEIQFTNYIAGFATATVTVEQPGHPVMKTIPRSFIVEKEEWYTYSQSPRQNVMVLASVDESTYSPGSTIKMGDHPVIWMNDHKKARNIYIFMGHHPSLFKNNVYTSLFRNAILWASSR